VITVGPTAKNHGTLISPFVPRKALSNIGGVRTRLFGLKPNHLACIANACVRTLCKRNCLASVFSERRSHLSIDRRVDSENLSCHRQKPHYIIALCYRNALCRTTPQAIGGKRFLPCLNWVACNETKTLSFTTS